MKRPRRPAAELRRAIDCMPAATRVAMLDAIRVNPIIVGAYTDRDGGVCPMLAAHRNGGRTSFASFARAWDRYTRAGGAPRAASERELRALTAMLEASITIDEVRDGHVLAQAIAEHRESQGRSARGGAAGAAGAAPPPPPRRPTGERDRTPELRGRRGWSWLRPFRRLDDYEKALARLEAERREREPALPA